MTQGGGDLSNAQGLCLLAALLVSNFKPRVHNLSKSVYCEGSLKLLIAVGCIYVGEKPFSTNHLNFLEQKLRILALQGVLVNF